MRQATQQGFSNIESLLEKWAADIAERRSREEAVHRINELQERLAAKYGTMPDSVPLIHEDRER
jgi:hypothetical protein